MCYGPPNTPRKAVHASVHSARSLYTGRRKEAILSLRWPQVSLEEVSGRSEPFDRAMANARVKGWRIYEVPCGHGVMLDMPERLAAILARQMPDAEKRARAHFIVDTGRGFAAAKRQVRGIVRALAGAQNKV